MNQNLQGAQGMQPGGRPAVNSGGRSAVDVMAMFAPAGAPAYAPAFEQAARGAHVPQNPADGGFQNANGGMAGAPNGAQQPGSPAAVSQQPVQQQQQQSPFADFEGMFKIDDKTANPVDALNSPVFAMDAEKLQQHVSKMNFAQQIDPQQMQAILQGDGQALSTVLNSVAQNVFQQTARFMQSAMENGFGTYNGRLNAALPVHMRQFMSQQEVARELPFAGDPGVAPMVQALQSQFLRANPNMSPQEVSSKVKQFLQTVASQMQSQQPQPQRDPFTGAPLGSQQQQQMPGNEAWDDFFRM